MLLDERCESVGISALESVDDTLVLEEKEGGHGTNAVSLSDRLHTVDVDFEEDDARVLYSKAVSRVVRTRRGVSSLIKGRLTGRGMSALPVKRVAGRRVR